MNDAANAFTEALGIGFTVAGACAVAGAVVVKLWLPARHRAPEAEVVELPRRLEIQEQAA